MEKNQTKLTNEFYQEALRAKAVNERYRTFLTRSLPALLAYLPGYDQQTGRAVMEEIAKNIEGDSDIQTLTRELWELKNSNSLSELESAQGYQEKIAAGSDYVCDRQPCTSGIKKRKLSKVFPRVFPVFLAHFPKTRGCLKVSCLNNKEQVRWMFESTAIKLLSEEAQKAIAFYNVDSEIVVVWPPGDVEVLAYE